MAYPFEVPGTSYLWRDGAVCEPAEVTTHSLRGRTPVLAVGSNAAPAQLTRKFSGAPPLGEAERSIPVLRAVARDLDVVYGALVASYGSIPATAVRARGTEAHVFVSWLTDRQLDTMHASEGLGRTYHLEHVDEVRMEGREIGPVWYYAATAGPLRLDGALVGLRAVPCPGSRLLRISQAGLWSRLAHRLGPGLRGAEYAAAVRGDPVLRAELLAYVCAGSAPPPHRSDQGSRDHGNSGLQDRP